MNTKKTRLIVLFMMLMLSTGMLLGFGQNAECCSMQSVEENQSQTERGDTMNSDKELQCVSLPYNGADKTIEIDFSARDYSRTPYLKKFDMFTSTWAWCDAFAMTPEMNEKNLSCIDDVAELLPETFRTDLFMGFYGIGYGIGENKSLSGKTDAEYAAVKCLTDTLKASHLGAEFVYFASPKYTGGGTTNNAWKRVRDLDKWEELCCNIAAYFKKNDMKVVRHEVWNEPDYYISDPEKDGVYFLGTWQDYINVYVSGARGIRAADSDALIGGVSAAWMNKISQNGDFKAFLEQTNQEEVLPDYVSWHFYGSNGGLQMLPEYISGARACLEESDDYDTVQQHLNEFNVSLDTNVTNSCEMTRSVLEVYNQLLDATDITRVTWTSAFDRNLEGVDGCPLINPVTGERTPAFYTMWMYARLPISPVLVSNPGKTVEVMASVGDTRAAFLAYDVGITDTEVTFELRGIPFENGNIKVYTLDSEDPQSSVTSNSPKLLAEYQNVALTDLIKYSVRIPKEGAVYFQIDKLNSEANAHERISPLSEKVVRTDYWYNGRDDGGSYAWMSSNSFVASIGSGHSDKSHGMACVVTMEDMKDTDLSLETVVSEEAKKVTDTSMLGVTVAYSVNGQYVKTVYHMLNGIDGSATIPLGTKRIWDERVALGEGCGTYALDLASYAPEGWDGRIQLGFVVNDLNDNQGAEFIVNLR